MLGEVIQGYRVESALSADKGGFGDVYFAVHVDSGAEAVVKVLKPEMSAQRDIVARFFNEARAAASVHHPGVVQIHNVGYHRDRAYLLMERLRGDDLEERLARGPLPVDRALVFVRQAAGAIGAAHDRGIVHRDLKPANLFVVADPDVVGGERVKVLDFGIAKLTADAGAGKTQGVFGTPAYMSPEQCASTGAVDARSDLYSLGCILYELVCGRPPFGQGGIELIAAQLRDTPPPPRAIAPWLPPAVEQVILRLLEKQPERRYASCAALIAALDEAAAAAGLLGASGPHPAAVSAPWLTETTVPGSVPPGASAQLAAVAKRQPYPTTLGAAAGSSTVQPGGRGRGLWLGLAAVIVVVGAVVAVLAMPGRHAPEVATGSGSAGSAALAAVDAGSPPADAAQIAQAAADAAAAPDPDEDDASSDAAVVVAAQHDAAVPRSAKPAFAASASEQQVAARLANAGKDALYRNDYERARSLYEQATAHSPEAKYFRGLAVANLQLGRLGEALPAARRARALALNDAQRSQAERLIEKIDQEARRQGLTLDRPITPEETGAHNGSAHEEHSLAPDAGTDAEVARLYEKGTSEERAGRYQSALSLFRQAYELSPRADILLDIGRMEYQLVGCVDARRTLQRVTAIWPGEPPAKAAQQLLDRLGACR